MEKSMEPLELKMAEGDPRPCPHCDKPQYKNYLRHEPKCDFNPVDLVAFGVDLVKVEETIG